MKRILEFQCEGKPTDNEIEEAIEMTSDGYQIHLYYEVFDYTYKIVVNQGDTFADVKSRIPKIYGG